MKRPLSITSPTHAWALVTYFILGFSGLAGILNFNSQSSVIAAMGDGVADIYSTILLLSGWGCFVAAIVASKSLKPEYLLLIEMYLCMTIFVDLSFFLCKAIEVAGWRGFTTALFAVIFVAGSALRAWQIRYELKLIRVARAHPSEADPVMGDPRDKSDEPR